MRLVEMLESKMGKIIVSILLGLGLATLFRKTCKDKKCLIFVPPNMETMKEDVYEYNGKCYKYKESSVTCDPSKVRVKRNPYSDYNENESV